MKKKILLVDDSPNMRNIVRRFLTSQNVDCEFTEAGNGEEADRLLQEHYALDRPFDLVVLDWMMPKFSGYEFLKKMRSVEMFRETPAVIMLTAETYAEQIEACLKFGVSAYLTKPFTEEQIATKVKEVLSMKSNKAKKVG